MKYNPHLKSSVAGMNPEPVINEIDFEVMFPNVDSHAIRYVLHVCGLRDVPAQTRLIEFEGIDEVDDLANYTDAEIDQMADRNSKRSPPNQRVQFGLKRTKYLKAVCYWVRKNVRESITCDQVDVRCGFSHVCLSYEAPVIAYNTPKEMFPANFCLRRNGLIH